MLRLSIRRAALAAAIAGLWPTVAAAQSSVVNFTLGYFVVRGEDARVDDDVLIADLSDRDPLLFEIADFNGGHVEGEWLVALGRHVELGAGIGYYRRTVPSIYRGLVRPDGSEIEQDLKLRIAPISATIRFLPLGLDERVQPYFGGGVGIFNWRYSETGEFIDPADRSIFPARYVGAGNAVGPIFLGGLRYVADPWVVGGEIRYQRAEGDLPFVDEDPTNGFLGRKIDLGGFTTQVTVGIRF